jgi:hypothetical protein
LQSPRRIGSTVGLRIGLQRLQPVDLVLRPLLKKLDLLGGVAATDRQVGLGDRIGDVR